MPCRALPCHGGQCFQNSRQNIAQTHRCGTGCILVCLLGKFLSRMLRCSPLHKRVFGLHFAYLSGNTAGGWGWGRCTVSCNAGQDTRPALPAEGSASAAVMDKRTSRYYGKWRSNLPSLERYPEYLRVSNYISIIFVLLGPLSWENLVHRLFKEFRTECVLKMLTVQNI